MAASVAAAYRSPDEYESEKTPSPFKRIDQVRASTLAERHRNLIVAMLHKNRFGDELWMSTESICVVMGRVCYRRKQSGWSTHEKPRQLHGCDQISRRAVQRLIDELVYCRECGKSSSAHSSGHAFVPRVDGGGVLDEIYSANSAVPYGGGKKFRHTVTYRLNPDKLVPRKTHDQYVEERDRGRARSRQLHREESEREHAEAKSDVTPIRKPAKQPAAEHAHRNPVRAASVVGGTAVSDLATKAAHLLMEMCGLADIGALPQIAISITAEAKFRGIEIEEAAKYIAECAVRDQKNGIALTRFYFRDLKWRSHGGQQVSPSQQRFEQNRRAIGEGILSNYRDADADDGGEREGDG